MQDLLKRLAEVMAFVMKESVSIIWRGRIVPEHSGKGGAALFWTG